MSITKNGVDHEPDNQPIPSESKVHTHWEPRGTTDSSSSLADSQGENTSEQSSDIKNSYFSNWFSDKLIEEDIRKLKIGGKVGRPWKKSKDFLFFSK